MHTLYHVVVVAYHVSSLHLCNPTFRIICIPQRKLFCLSITSLHIGSTLCLVCDLPNPPHCGLQLPNGSNSDNSLLALWALTPFTPA